MIPALPVVAALFAGAAISGPREPRMASFADICPPGVMMLVEVPDFEDLQSSLERTGLMDMWNDKRIRAYFESSELGADTPFEDVLERAGVELDALSWPTGAAGFALIHDSARLRALEAGPEAFVDLIYTDAEPQPLFAADFGAGADAAQAAFESLLDFAERHNLAEIDGDNDDDRLVVIHSLVHERFLADEQQFQAEYQRRLQEAGRDWEKMNEIWKWYEEASVTPEVTGDAAVDLLASALAQVPSLAFARAGTVILLAAETDLLSRTLDAMEDPSRPSAADQPFYSALQPHLVAGADAWLFVNLELSNRFAQVKKEATEIQRKRTPRRGENTGFDPFEASPFAVLADFVAFKGDGLGFSLTLDQGDALARVRFAAPTDTKSGIWALMDRSGLPFSLPAFAPQDSFSAVRLLIDLPAIPGEIDRLVNALPGDAQGQVRPVIDQAMPFLQQICGSMGDEIHLISTREGTSSDALGLPGLGQLAGGVIAISLKDDRVLNNLLSAFGGAMGLQGKNLEGGTLFSSEQMGIPIALAIGSGRAFIGSVPQLEDALRALVHPVEPSDAPNPFDRAKLDGRGPLAGYFMLKPTIEAMERQAEAMRRQFEQFAEDNPDFAEVEDGPKFPTDVLLKHMGDIAFQAHSPDWGFSGEIVLLRPREE